MIVSSGYNNAGPEVEAALLRQIGWTGDQVFTTDTFVGQARQALQNIVAVLAEADAAPEHLVRLTWFVVDKAEYLDNVRELGGAYREIIGTHYPAMSLVQVVALLEDAARVEIEATAVVPHSYWAGRHERLQLSENRLDPGHRLVDPVIGLGPEADAQMAFSLCPVERSGLHGNVRTLQQESRQVSRGQPNPRTSGKA